MPETAKRTARVPILGEDGRISDDYIPAAIGEGVESAEAAATRAKTAATAAESAKTAAEKARDAAGTAQNGAESAQTAAEAARTAAEKAKADAESAGTAAANSASRAAASAQSAASSATSAQEDASTAQSAAETATAQAQAASSSATAAARSAADAKASADRAAGWVPADGEPGQILTKTEDGTAWRDAPSGNVLKGTATDYVAHADDAYAQKPLEVRVKGRTVKNLWPAINGSQNGITVSTDETGLITVSGTATADATITAEAAYAPSSAYVMASTYGSPSTWYIVNGETQVTSGTQLAAPSATCGVTVKSGTAVNASFRVMLVEGDTAPDCFVPTGLHSVEPGNLVTAGKNLLRYRTALVPGYSETSNGVTFTVRDDGGILVNGSATGSAIFCLDFRPSTGVQGIANPLSPCLYGQNVACSLVGASNTTLNVGAFLSVSNNFVDSFCNTSTRPTNKIPMGATATRSYLLVKSGASVNEVVYPQLELGSTATAYEPPNVTTTPLPEVELRSLPDGTCDELVIKADGTATVERRTQLSGDEVTALPEPTTEPQSPVTLPALPAPTFNAYHDSQVPSDTTVEYARDINIVIDNLAKQIAGTAATVAINEATR